MRIDDTQARPAAQRGRLGEVALRLRVGGVLAFLLILGLAFSLLSGQFLTPQNLSVVVANAAILAIVACAQALVLLTRNLDVSVGSIMGLAAYLTADYAAPPSRRRNRDCANGVGARPRARRHQRSDRSLWQGVAADRDTRHDVAVSRLHLHLRAWPAGDVQHAAAVDAALGRSAPGRHSGPGPAQHCRRHPGRVVPAPSPARAPALCGRLQSGRQASSTACAPSVWCCSLMR